MYCPVCENEYDPDVEQCPNCGSQLVDNLLGGSTEASTSQNPVSDRGLLEQEETSPEPSAVEDAEPAGPVEDSEPVEAITPDELPELVQIYTANGLEADLIRSVIEGSGIAVLIKRSGMEGVYGPVHDTHLLVREEDEERAREVIRAARAGEFEIEDDE